MDLSNSFYNSIKLTTLSLRLKKFMEVLNNSTLSNKFYSKHLRIIFPYTSKVVKSKIKTIRI